VRVSYSWLSEFVRDLPDVDEVAARLTLAGLEVESVMRPDRRLIDGLVCARIVELAKHPNADRLTLCRVDDGTDVVPIVCGATNMKAGDVVVLAHPGTVLPDGREIRKSKIRGEESRGMLCAAREVGIDDESTGIMILDAAVPAGRKAATLLGIDVSILEVAVTPNRGDCLSVRGLAREIAAVCRLELSPAFDRAPSSRDGVGRMTVRIDAAESCPFYSGLEIREVSVGPSPAWLAARLRASGLRSINNVVDVTNYVLWELGQPLHAFDADCLVGETIRVGVAGENAAITTLDGQTRELGPEDLVIRDGAGPVALAGVMGGARTAVNAGTRNLFLESAAFAPARVRAASRRLGLISDSSYRFERGVDIRGVERALLRAADLLLEIAGGRVEGGVSRTGDDASRRTPIRLRPERMKQLLGIEIDADEAVRSLTRLGARVGRADDGALDVLAPSHRNDLDREVDLIEEVVRLHGYDSIPSVPPSLARATPVDRGGRALADRVRAAMRARGMSEIVALGFCSGAGNRRFAGLHDPAARSVEVENPLRSDAQEMRRSVVPSLLAAREWNVRNGATRTDLFSVARTFSAGPPPVELDCVAGLFAGPRRTRGPRDDGVPEFGDVKGAVEHVLAAAGCRQVARWEPRGDGPDLHPRASAAVFLGDARVGYAGEVHPDALAETGVEGPLFVFELDLAALAARGRDRDSYLPLPRFPASTRDVSLLVANDLPAGRVIAEALALGEAWLERVVVFDEYRGPGLPEGKRALAFRLTYRAAERTLTEEDVIATHTRVLSHIVSALPVELRA
jgi:phenylalanyl-tRNA synthetase beta chain